MCLVRVHKTSTRTDFPNLVVFDTDYTCSTPLSHRQLLTGLGLLQKNTKKNAPRRSTRNASCHHTNEKENTKSRRKLEEKTFVTTKSARRLKKKSAHTMNATKTADFHSTTMKKTQQAKKIILKTGLNT